MHVHGRQLLASLCPTDQDNEKEASGATGGGQDEEGEDTASDCTYTPHTSNLRKRTTSNTIINTSSEHHHGHSHSRKRVKSLTAARPPPSAVNTALIQDTIPVIVHYQNHPSRLPKEGFHNKQHIVIDNDHHLYDYDNAN